ncbi:hypothetical protein Tco_0774208 [Tanacetum coccineum]|uniref:Uncharacterized protein n=1 Tax=Tanacetum coccineum TaxID=301880 RepID=A0ABQ4ZRK3_9ASTR
METKDTLSSCTDLDEQETQQLHKQAKILKKNSLNTFNALKTTTQRLERQTFTYCSLLQQALAHLFHIDVRTFKYELSQNMNNLEKQLNNEILHEKDSKSALSVIKVQFDKFIHSDVLKPIDPYSSYASYDRELQNGLKRLNERKLQIQECKVQKVKASDASSGDNDYIRIVSDKEKDQGLENQSNTSGDESNRSRNECNDKSTSGDNTDIRPSYDTKPMVEVPYTAEYNVFAVDTQHYEQPECIINTCVVDKADSNVTPDSPDMCDNDIQNDQNVLECDNERVALANLKLDVDENKKIQKQLKKANASLNQELIVALQNKQTELEKYMTFKDRTVGYDKLERKLNETLRLLAQKDIDIKEGLKLKAYEILVVQEKHDELVKQSLLTKLHYEGLVKEKTKVIMDLKLKEEKDIEKMISMENQLKFLNEIVYKKSQSVQTIHMLAPKYPTFNGRPTFANPMYLKKAQNKKPCLYEIPHDQSDPANRLIPDKEKILTLKEESRSKLNKDLVKPYDYTKELVDQAWVKHSNDHFRAPTTQDMEILIKTCLMPLALKTQNDSLVFVHELKKEMHVDLKYVESFEKEIDELESDKAKFSNIYDMLLQECMSNDVM